MDSRTVIKKIVAGGWYEVSQKGSHKKFKHPTKKGRVIVSHPNKHIKIGTLKSIERQSGVPLK